MVCAGAASQFTLAATVVPPDVTAEAALADKLPVQLLNGKPLRMPWLWPFQPLLLSWPLRPRRRLWPSLRFYVSFKQVQRCIRLGLGWIGSFELSSSSSVSKSRTPCGQCLYGSRYRYYLTAVPPCVASTLGVLRILVHVLEAVAVAAFTGV